MFKTKEQMNSVAPSDDFLLSRLIVNGKTVPILVLDGKLVALPSRFALYSIEKMNLKYSQAKWRLKCLAKFLSYLSGQDGHVGTAPDTALLSATNDDIERFLKTGRIRGNDAKRTLLLLDFFTWLEQEEGVALTKLKSFNSRLFSRKKK